MSKQQKVVSYTQHAFLVAWGRFAQEIGLIENLARVKLKQKKYQHKPQTKVIEFLVSHLAGLKHLQEISLSAHPLDKDRAVAEAWGQAGWADYTGVSRTLSQLSWEEVEQLGQVLQEVSQGFVQEQVKQVQASGQRLWYDGDLTGLPVSNTSNSYPNTAFGHMDDEIRLGYQAAVVSLKSPTYGRLWLSVAHHPGDTVSCTQVTAMVQAAEEQTGLRPRRREQMLQQRLQILQTQLAVTEKRRQSQQNAVTAGQVTLETVAEQENMLQKEVADLHQLYQVKGRLERPTSQLAKSRQRLQAVQGKRSRWEQRLQVAQKRLSKTQIRWEQQQADWQHLQQRLSQLEQDNATNLQPIEAVFRLDAGFGTYENIAFLIEMGYDVYTKPYSHQLVKHLKSNLSEQTTWTQVGSNAEMVVWPKLQLKGCPYPINVALERFYTGKTIKHSALLHFGSDLVTQDLRAWFDTYNARQTIEAGIKESKLVFHLHRIKVRSEPAIYLQEQFVIFAANFIRWASLWVAQHAIPVENALDISALGIKRQVQVAAHVSAHLVWDSDGWLLRFTEYSAFAGKVLKLPAGLYQPPHLTLKNVLFKVFSMIRYLIAQP